MTWNDRFLELFDRCTALYRGGNTDFTTYFDGGDVAFLATIGYKTREFFDFVEDFCEEGEPSASTALLVAAVRRDYFIVMQENVTSNEVLTRDELPTFGDTLDSMPYLPRILAKARGKLRGELDPDIMFGCGGDRKFLRDHGNIQPADFLRHVWAAHEDDALLASWIRDCKAGK
ncbi:MAG: hypothetical protein QM755_09495 [Luteolibacter sp.]